MDDQSDTLDLLETSARLGAQEFLLEILYANVFAHDPQGLDRLMAELIRLTSAAPTRPQPISDDDMSEMQLRITLSLQRFQTSVQDRISTRRLI